MFQPAYEAPVVCKGAQAQARICQHEVRYTNFVEARSIFFPSHALHRPESKRSA